MPVLKVKKNGVWEPVGGMAGSSGGSSDSGLPEYSEEDYGKVLSPSADGLVWAEQSSGSDDGSEIPFFDLGEMGLPAISFDGTLVSANVDCTEIRTALAAGPVKITFNIDWNGNIVPFTVVTNALFIPAEDNYQVGIVQTMIWNGVPVVKTGSFNFFTNKITSRVLPIQKELPTPIESDIGKVLTVTEDGLVWTEQSSDSGESDVLIVTIDTATNTASHSASEISAAVSSGKAVFADVGDTRMPYYTTNNTGAIFAIVDVSVNAVYIAAVCVDDTKAVRVTNNAYSPNIDAITAKVGQIARVKTVGNNGKPVAWEAVDMPSSGSENSRIFAVTVDPDTVTSSHSVSDIRAAFNDGKAIIAYYERLVLDFDGFYDGMARFFKTFFSSNHIGTVSVMIKEDKSYESSAEAAPLVPTPTEADYGKVLSATADGFVWVEQKAGGEIVSDIKSVEGVVF